MSVAEIKETKSSLKEWIDQLSDNDMLFMLDKLRTADVDKYSWNDLSEFQKQQIGEGLIDIENGHVFSSAEFWDQLKND